MALPWFKVTSSLVHHPKLAALERLLAVDGLGVLIRLWAWTAAYYPDGTIPHTSVELMAEEATRGCVTGDVTVTATVTALVEVGFLDAVDGGYEIHDWSEMQGAHLVAAEKNRERQRRFRERNRNVTRGSNRRVTPQSRGEETRSEEKAVGAELENPAAAAAPKAEPELPLPQGPPSPLVEYLTSTWSDIRRPKAEALEVEHRKACPSIDLLAEAKKARAHEVAKRVPYTSHAKFMGAWWLRAQNWVAQGKAPPVARGGVLSGPRKPTVEELTGLSASTLDELREIRDHHPERLEPWMRDALQRAGEKVPPLPPKAEVARG